MVKSRFGLAHTILVCLALMLGAAGCHRSRSVTFVHDENVSPGGEPAITIALPPPAAGQLAYESATVLPGLGMNTLQIRAQVPGKGTVNLLASPDLQSAASVREGSAFGAPVLLPGPDAALMPATKMTEFFRKATRDTGAVTGVLRGSDFHGKWKSRTDATTATSLSWGEFAVNITARNTGGEDEEAAIAWRVYLAMPSADARVRVPEAAARSEKLTAEAELPGQYGLRLTAASPLLMVLHQVQARAGGVALEAATQTTTLKPGVAVKLQVRLDLFKP